MPYRDDYDAMANRCSELERELSRSRAELEQARRARSLPLLDQIRVASPCKASWDAMEGGDQVRFCVQCSKNVYDLSGMTREAAEQLVQETEGRVCVRFYRRADGTVLTSDCPVGARKLRFRRAAIAAVGAGILALGAAWATATTHHRPEVGELMMGAIAVPQTGQAPPPNTVRMVDPPKLPQTKLHPVMGGPVMGHVGKPPTK